VETVLVVDDDASFAERLVVFLQELLPGREIVVVGDGNAALTRALDLRPKDVLLDVGMPGPSGVRVATALAQALPATHIVILSGGDKPGDLPAGADYVRKDADMEDRLRELLT
jgi:CheY-like chemotaxis protein